MTATIMLKRNASLVWNYLNNEIILIEPRNGFVHVLNDSGAIIWSALEAYKTRDELIETIYGKYDINIENEDIVKNDVADFINELIMKEIIIEVEI